MRKIVELERREYERDRLRLGIAVEIVRADNRQIDDAAAHLIGGLERTAQCVVGEDRDDDLALGAVLDALHHLLGGDVVRMRGRRRMGEPKLGLGAGPAQGAWRGERQNHRGGAARQRVDDRIGQTRNHGFPPVVNSQCIRNPVTCERQAAPAHPSVSERARA